MNETLKNEIKLSIFNYKWKYIILIIFLAIVAFDFAILSYIQGLHVLEILVIGALTALTFLCGFGLAIFLKYRFVLRGVNRIVSKLDTYNDIYYIRLYDRLNGLLVTTNDSLTFYPTFQLAKTIEFKIDEMENVFLFNKWRMKYANILKKQYSYIFVIKTTNRKQYMFSFDDVSGALDRYNHLKHKIKDDFFESFKDKYYENNIQFYNQYFTKEWLETINEQTLFNELTTILEESEIKKLYPDSFLIFGPKVHQIESLLQSENDFFTYLINEPLHLIDELVELFDTLKAYQFKDYTLAFIDAIKPILKYPYFTYLVALGALVDFNRDYDFWEALQLGSHRISGNLTELYFNYFKNNISKKL